MKILKPIDCVVISAVVEAGGVLDSKTSEGKMRILRSASKLGLWTAGPKKPVLRDAAKAKHDLAAFGVFLPRQSSGAGIWALNVEGFAALRGFHDKVEYGFPGVYLFSYQDVPERVKIGWALDVPKRGRALLKQGQMAGVPSVPLLQWIVKSDDPRSLEGALKAIFKHKKKHVEAGAGCEWFEISVEELSHTVQYLEPHADQGPPSHFFPLR
tara:strand:- start:684 stop:1319 length:636 start_codon:yes stop_codon:yes gene_type:complete